MTKKKLKIIGVVSAFLLAFPIHFLYKWLPNPIFAIFFPVNESIWEHMKMLTTTFILTGLLEHIIVKWKNINVKNFWIGTFIESIISIPIYLIIFLPFYFNMPTNMFITIGTMLITIIITKLIGYYIISTKKNIIPEYITIILIIITYIIFGILTYHPPKNFLFFDTEEEKYGINIYHI